MRNRSIDRRGFTLVEVMLALAIVSIGLIAILGLLPTGLRAARDAGDNTLSATIVQDTFTGLRTNAFHSAMLCDTCTITPQDLGTYDTIANPAKRVFNYYDSDGFSTPQATAYYKVILDFQPQTPVLTRVTASVVWPAQAKNPVNNSIFVTQIARYDQ